MVLVWLGGDALEVVVGNDDVSAETGVGADVFEVVGLFGAFVKERLELDSPARVHFGLVSGLVGPLSRVFDDERFAVGIEFVGHRKIPVGCVFVEGTVSILGLGQLSIEDGKAIC